LETSLSRQSLALVLTNKSQTKHSNHIYNKERLENTKDTKNLWAAPMGATAGVPWKLSLVTPFLVVDLERPWGRRRRTPRSNENFEDWSGQGFHL